MSDNSSTKKGYEVLFDCFDATREGDHERVLDCPCNGAGEGGERSVLEGDCEQEMHNPRSLTFYERRYRLQVQCQFALSTHK